MNKIYSNNYSIVKSKFYSYFELNKKHIYKSAAFFKRKQPPGEPVNSFVSDFLKLAESCKFMGLKEEIVQDLLVYKMKSYLNYYKWMIH